MDTNHSTIRKSDEQVIWSLSTSDDQLGCTSSVRSYTCAFCKKGFSNAQALGGHMNIHRRDRAKLRESFDETKSINPPHDHHPLPDQASHQGKNPFRLESVEEGSRIPKSPQSLSLEDSADKDLPFSMNSKMCNFHDGDDDDNKLKLSQRTIQTELDLELRLGPEPHEISSSSSTRSTRGFF